jgi:hypothetical protein
MNSFDKVSPIGRARLDFQLLKTLGIRIRKMLYCFSILLIVSIHCLAQQQVDTTATKATFEELKKSRNFKKLMTIIGKETKPDNSEINTNSEDPYLPYEGKIIRKITIERLGFDKNVIDSARTFKNYISNTANKVHLNTREYVVRNNLFVREGRPLNPYRVADNERSLRSLDFIKDARIYAQPIDDNPDSVDLLVVTRDVFGIGGSFSANLPQKYSVRLRDNNLVGTGHFVQIGQVFDVGRRPRYGYEGAYQYNNVMGSFINATAGYTQLNRGISIGNESEQSLFLKVERELYQPFARFAGALEYSQNRSVNYYGVPDSTFAQYQYHAQDYWLGYSFALRKSPPNLKENRNRTFVAIRRFEQDFSNASNIDLTETARFIYRDLETTLVQLTFFKQDFFKTQYVSAFGITEDIPYGYRFSVTTGTERELGQQRAYIGSELYYNNITPKGAILSYSLKLGTFWDKGGSEDGLASLSFTYYSRMFELGKLIIRQKSDFGYATVINPNIKRGLDIRNTNGIIGFWPDSLTGVQRIKLGHEATVFTPLKLIGFRIAIVGSAEVAMLQQDNKFLKPENIFMGFSTGLRFRNENLIFNTLEARVFYYPKTVEGLEYFRLMTTANFRVRFPTNLVNKPAIAMP